MLNESLIQNPTGTLRSMDNIDVTKVGLCTDENGFKFISISGHVANMLIENLTHAQLQIDIFYPVKVMCNPNKINASYFYCELFGLYLHNSTCTTGVANISLKMQNFLKTRDFRSFIYAKFHIPHKISENSFFKSVVTKCLSQKKIHNFFVVKLFKFLISE